MNVSMALCRALLLATPALGGCAALLQGDPVVEVVVPNAAVTFGWEPRLRAEHGGLLAPHMRAVDGFTFKADRRLGYTAILSPLGYSVPLKRQWRPTLWFDAVPALAGLAFGAGVFALEAVLPSPGALPMGPSTLLVFGGLGLLSSAALLGGDAFLGAWWETPPQQLSPLVP